MSLVVVRDARPADARAVVAVQSAATPHLVRSAAQVAAELRSDGQALRDPAQGRRRWVAEIAGRVVGTASRSPSAVDEHVVSVEVDPAYGSRGAGSALLDRAVGSVTDAHRLRGVAGAHPVALAFAVRGGFLPETELGVGTVATHQAAAGPVPQGLRPVSLDMGLDSGCVARWWEEAAVGDPGRLVRPTVLADLSRRTRGAPDHAPELSWGLVADDPPDEPEQLVALCTARVDREGTRAAVEVTAVRPSYRRAGVATWALRRTLAALHAAGLDAAWVHHDLADPASVALARDLGVQVRGRAVLVERRLLR